MFNLSLKHLLASFGVALAVLAPLMRPAIAQDETESPAKVLDRGFDCFSCHAIDREVVGPAWSAIAAHYHHDESKASYLATKIREGGVGDFGRDPMPAHPDMDAKVAQRLAQYILTLNAPIQRETPKKYSYKNTTGKRVNVGFPVFQQVDNKQVVTDEIFGGFEKYNSYCFRCHGFDAVGGEYAPDLRKSLNDGMSKHQFFTIAMEGRESKGMPGWAGFFNAQELNQVFEYVEARALDLIGPGRPPSKGD